MCGIFGYTGERNAEITILEGLKRLEYRGYDSWGIATTTGSEIITSKSIDPIPNAQEATAKTEAKTGIGHTRWATHGGVSILNCHPHESSNGDFTLAQNGIVENYQVLKAELITKGHKFVSETDTEVIVRLIEEKQKKSPKLSDAIREAFLELKGRNTIIILPRDGSSIIAVRNGSPLVVGVGEDEIFIASDTLSFADKTHKVAYIEHNQMVIVDPKQKQFKIFQIADYSEVNYQVEKLDVKQTHISTEGYDHFMIKEIIEQKDTIKQAFNYTEADLEPLLEAIRKARRVYTIAAGTAGFAAGQIAYFLREYAGIFALELKAYEFSNHLKFVTDQDLVITISQSGESADTLNALDQFKKKGVKIVSIVNALGSSISRMSDFPFYTHAGPEICVAATKSFTAQIGWGLMVALSVNHEYAKAQTLATKISKELYLYFNENLFEQIKKIADEIKDEEHLFVLGKGQNFYITLEAALKIQEITYKHIVGLAAGELKHGVIALLEKGTHIFVIVSEDEDKADLLSAIAETRARGATIIAIAENDNPLFDRFIQVPKIDTAQSIINVIPFQLISYYLAVILGRHPDKPRNLAKSVTVK